MSSTISSHAIAPANVLRGSGAWGESLSLIAELCQKPFVLGRSGATAELRQKLKSDLEATGLSGCRWRAQIRLLRAGSAALSR